MVKKEKIISFILIFALLVTLIPVSDVQAAGKKNGYYAKINKGTNVVTIYKNSDNSPYTAFTCSTGQRTPTGTFYTSQKYRWRTLFGPCYGQYCTRITGSILFHSVWYYSTKKNSQSYAEYNKLGKTASHGCVRLTVAASKWIYDNCPSGMKVIIFNGSAKDDPLGKPKTIRVSGGRTGWDPTDPDSANPYKTGSTKPEITVSKTTLDYGAKVRYSMKCRDSGGSDITKWVKRSGKINTKKAGDYKVTFSVTDSFGRSAKKTVTYHVRDKGKPVLSGVEEELGIEYNTKINLREKVRAKTKAGTDLTDKIRIYVKQPKESGYRECTKDKYTFDRLGVYRIKYTVKNPSGGKTAEKILKVTVADTQPPVLNSERDWDSLYKEMQKEQTVLSWEELMEDVSAFLVSGAELTDTVKITITSPSGETAELVKGMEYTVSGSGEYQLTYTVYNASVSTVRTRTLTAVLPQENAQPEEF